MLMFAVIIRGSFLSPRLVAVNTRRTSSKSVQVTHMEKRLGPTHQSMLGSQHASKASTVTSLVSMQRASIRRQSYATSAVSNSSWVGSCPSKPETSYWLSVRPILRSAEKEKAVVWESWRCKLWHLAFLSDNLIKKLNYFRSLLKKVNMSSSQVR